MSEKPGATVSTDPRDALFDTSQMMDRLGRRAGTASIFALAVAALKVMQQIVSIAIIARLVPPAEYGIYALALPGVMIAIALSNFGLPQAIVQRQTITHSHVSALFWLNAAFAVMITVVLALLGQPAAAFYDEPAVAPVFAWVSLSLLFSAMASQYVSILRRTLQIRSAELLTLAAEFCGLVVAISAALMGMSYWALVLQQIVTPALKTLFMALKTGWLPSLPHRVRFADALGSVAFGGYVAGFSILDRMTEYAGTVITRTTFDTATTGLFYRARHLGGIAPQRVVDPLSGVFIPTMSRLQDAPEDLRAAFVRLISRGNLILLPIAVLLASGAEPLVRVLLGPEWTAAAPLMFWMSLFTLREGGASGLRFVLTAYGTSRPLFLFGVVRLLLIIAVLLTGAQYGVVVMCAAYMLTELFVTLPMQVAVAHRVTPITAMTFARACVGDMVLAILLAGALIAFANPLLDPLPAVLHLLVLGVLIGLTFAGRIILSPTMRHDVLRVVQTINGRIGRSSSKA